MSLFKQVEDDLEKYQPKLVEVKLIGNLRSGENEQGITIMSLDIDDNGTLPVTEDRLKTRTKRVCFVSKKVAKHYLDHPDGNPKKKTFMLPVVQPDDLNVYWIRRIFPISTEDEKT